MSSISFSRSSGVRRETGIEPNFSIGEERKIVERLHTLITHPVQGALNFLCAVLEASESSSPSSDDGKSWSPCNEGFEICNDLSNPTNQARVIINDADYPNRELFRGTVSIGDTITIGDLVNCLPTMHRCEHFDRNE